MAKTMTVSEWGRMVNDVMATTEPIVNGKLGPKAMTPDIVYRALVNVRGRLAEAGVVLSTFQKLINAGEQRLAVAKRLIDQQHAMILKLDGNPLEDGPGAVERLSRSVSGPNRPERIRGSEVGEPAA